jgi:hypothetical protein
MVWSAALCSLSINFERRSDRVATGSGSRDFGGIVARERCLLACLAVPPHFAYLSSAQGPSEVDRSYKPALCVLRSNFSLGHHRVGREVVAWPAREHNDLKAMSLLGE